MRRKSARNATKVSPEKPKEDKSPKKSRRHSKRHKQTTSESESDDAVSLSSNDAVKEPVEKELWTVTQSDASNDIGKIKLCLSRPTPATPERSSKRLKSKPLINMEETPVEVEFEEKPTRRSRRRTAGSSPTKRDEAKCEAAETVEVPVDEKKGKGKSKGKHKSKIVEQPSEIVVETEMQSEISENVQVTAQSPQKDNTDDAEFVDHDCNQIEDDSNVSIAENENAAANDPVQPTPKLLSHDHDRPESQNNDVEVIDNDNLSNNDVSNNNLINEPVPPQKSNQNFEEPSQKLNETAENSALDSSSQNSTKFAEESSDVSMKEVTHFELNVTATSANESQIEEVPKVGIRRENENVASELKTDEEAASKEAQDDFKSESSDSESRDAKISAVISDAFAESEETAEDCKAEEVKVQEDAKLASQPVKSEEIKTESTTKVTYESLKDQKTEEKDIKIKPAAAEIADASNVESKVSFKEEVAPVEIKIQSPKRENAEINQPIEDSKSFETLKEEKVEIKVTPSKEEEEEVKMVRPDEKPNQVETTLPEDKVSKKDIAKMNRRREQPKEEEGEIPNKNSEILQEDKAKLNRREQQKEEEAQKKKEILILQEDKAAKREADKIKLRKQREEREEKEEAQRKKSEILLLQKEDSISMDESLEIQDEKVHEEMELSQQSPAREEAAPKASAPTTKDKEIVFVKSTTTRIRNWGSTNFNNVLDILQVSTDDLKEMFPGLSLVEEKNLKLETFQPRPYEFPKQIDRRVSLEENQQQPDVPVEENSLAFNRKISIVDDEASSLRPPPSPAKNEVSDVLFITNLVRPFTVKQLKGLLERTGQIREDGFWTDKIKSKCYVRYESISEAEATRNALHGVLWPVGNGKKLIIDYATPEDLENAKNPPVVAAPTPNVQNNQGKENQEPDLSVPKENIQMEQKAIGDNDWGTVEHRDSNRRSVSRDRSLKRRHSHSRPTRSPTPEYKKKSRKEEAVPQRAMDDLFRKTEAMPSIYWQPLSPEEIALKQQQRQERMEAHKRKIESQQQQHQHQHQQHQRSSKSSKRGSDYFSRGGGPYRRRY